MDKIKIVKAGKVAGICPQDLTVEFSDEPPEFSVKLEDFYAVASNWYEQQAEVLGNALIKTLPGGTLDRLICFLLKQKASYFRVPYVEPKKES